MSPDLPGPGVVRPAAAVNAAIRALALAAWGRPFTDAERAVYEQLLVEWAQAVRRPDVAEAA